MKTICLLATLVLCAPISFAQAPPPQDTLPVDTVTVDSIPLDTTQTDNPPVPVEGKDTLLFAPPASHGGIPVSDTVNFEARLRQNPTTALFKSLVVPGWGQLGNRRYVKAVLFAGLQVWFAGAAIHYGKQASDFKDLYNQATSVEIRNDYYSLYEDRRNERTKYIFFFGLATLTSVFDAFVDAHLSGSPDKQTAPVGLRVGPAATGTHAALVVRF